MLLTTKVCQQCGRAELVVVFKSNDASLIIAAGRLHMTRNLILNCRWLETRRAQPQFPVTFVSSFNLSSLICKYSVNLLLLNNLLQTMKPQIGI